MLDREARPRRWVLAGAAVVLVATVAACEFRTGSPVATLGNDVASCEQFQPASTAPCGPQPMVWSSISGPYTAFADGDPYATKCGRNLPASVADCSSGSYPGGATNALYDPNGYEFAIDVKPADVGRSMQFQVWDAGAHPRSAGSAYLQATGGSWSVGSTLVRRSVGSSFYSKNLGQPISSLSPGIPDGAVVDEIVSPTYLRMSAPATSSATGSVKIVSDDCDTRLAPFTTAPYNGAAGAESCQTGDSGIVSPFQIQVFDNDGVDDEVSYTVPLAGCSLYIAPDTGGATYKNKWATVCTFTPTKTGVFPVRVKSSAITLPDGTVVPDTGWGTNGFALRVDGATATRLYPLGEMSVSATTPGAESRIYLTELTAEDAGKTLQLDFFDPGDGTSGDYAIQILGPPSGAPNVVPSTGSVVPSTGLASTCRYNPVVSAARGPDVSAGGGADASNCRVVTQAAADPGGRYDNGWLSIELTIANTYSCTTDCWWTMRLERPDTASADRFAWSPVLFGQ